jgi:hypothetical protein
MGSDSINLHYTRKYTLLHVIEDSFVLEKVIKTRTKMQVSLLHFLIHSCR